MISPLSEGFKPLRLFRSRFISSSAEGLVVICPEAIVEVGCDEGEVEESVAGGPVFESGAGVVSATAPRCDHQYQPPTPSTPRKTRMNRPRIAPCHHRNCERVSDSPYADSIVSVGALL